MYFYLIFYLFFGVLGLVTLLTFFCSLYKPTKSTKRHLLAFFGMLLFMVFCLWLGETGRVSFGDDMGSVFFLFSLPPLAALLMSLAGIRALVDRSSQRWGLTLSFLDAAGCIGLTYGISALYFHPTQSEGGIAILLDVVFGGGIATIIALVFANKAWKKRLAAEKSANTTAGASEIRDDQIT